MTGMAEVPEFELRDGPETKYQQVAAHLEARIRAGELASGARLPGEQALAGEYEVALGTARRAVKILQDRGLVIIAPAKGVYIV